MLVDRGEVAVHQLFGLVRGRIDPRALTQLERCLLRGRPVAPRAGDDHAFLCEGLHVLQQGFLNCVGQPGDLLAVQRVDRSDRARVARGVAPRALDLRRGDDHLVRSLRELRLGVPRDEPDVAAEGLLGFHGQLGPALVRNADHDVGKRRPEHGLERVQGPAAGLRRVERGAAAGEDDVGFGRELLRGRNLPQPLGLREHRATCLSSHIPLYTMPRMSVYQRHTLSNGLRVLTAPLDHAQSVACYIMLAAGSRYEDASNRGIAHFAEHMFFKGTEKRPTARDLSMEVDKIGGEFNAFTSKEYTGYYIRCAGEQRDVALDVLVDMVRNSKFDGEELEREKGVIIEEMNMYFDTPRDYVGSMYEELVFGSNPLGWETLGTRETVSAATRETFMDYLAHWYAPPRMVVGVSGMVGNDLIPTLEGLLGDMSGNGKDRPAPAEVVRTPDALVRVRQKDSDQANVCLGVPSYPLDHPDRYALQLLGTVLGTGMSSRLFLEVRERRGLAYYVFAYNSSYTDAGRRPEARGGGGRGDRGGVPQARRRARRLGGAREGARAREGPVRAADREPERLAPVRPAPRGARGQGDRTGGAARRP